MSKEKDLTDKTFGCLYVIKRDYTPTNFVKKETMWLCKCLYCGTEQIRGRQAIILEPKYCKKCSRKAKTKKYLQDRVFATTKHLHAHYRTDAKRRKKEFDLTYEEFSYLISQECFYCGVIGSNFHSDRATDYKLRYNGLDRIDSSKGYTKENTITSCPRCNRAKNDMNLYDFMCWVEKIHENLSHKGLLCLD